MESILEGVEIKHPLVKAIRLARSAIISSRVYSPPLKFKSFRLSSHLSERNLPPKRKQGSRTQQKMNHPYERNHPSWAIFQCRPHVIVWLDSRIFFATLSPVHDPFALLVPGLLRRTRRESFHSIPARDASAALQT